MSHLGEGMVVIGRDERMGLGAMTEDFCTAFHPDQLIVMERGRDQLFDPYKVARLVHHCKTKLPSQLDLGDSVKMLVGFETYYDDQLVANCKKRGIKCVLFPMWEWSPTFHVHAADKLIVLSPTDGDYYESDHPIEMRWPASPACQPTYEWEEMVDPGTPRIGDMRQRRMMWPPRTFTHIAGNASHNRDGTREVLDAAVYLNGTGAKLVVYSAFRADQWQHDETAPIEFRQAAKSRRELYDGIDCLVQPRRLGGHSLPIDEAVGEGIPVVTLSGPDWESRASFTVGANSQPKERFGRVWADMHRADPAELGFLLYRLARGEFERPAPKSLPSWDDFKADWSAKIG